MHNEMFIWDQCEVYEELICLLTMPESARSVPDCFIAGLSAVFFVYTSYVIKGHASVFCSDILFRKNKEDFFMFKTGFTGDEHRLTVNGK